MRSLRTSPSVSLFIHSCWCLTNDKTWITFTFYFTKLLLYWGKTNTLDFFKNKYFQHAEITLGLFCAMSQKKGKLFHFIKSSNLFVPARVFCPYETSLGFLKCRFFFFFFYTFVLFNNHDNK